MSQIKSLPISDILTPFHFDPGTKKNVKNTTPHAIHVPVMKVAGEVVQ